MSEVALCIVIAEPVAVAVALLVLSRQMAHSAGWWAAAASLIAVAFAFALWPGPNQGQVPVLTLAWHPTARIVLGLRCDWITHPFLITTTVITALSIIYALGLHHAGHHAPAFYALLLLFGASMSGTTLADNMTLFYTFWELMLITSALLILVWGDASPGSPPRRAVAMKYFLVTHAGSILVLLALIAVYNQAGVDGFSALRNGVKIPEKMISTITLLFLVGFGVKMAVFPLHVWLPDAHTIAPMPVTIMLAAAMLSMGVYGILRFPLSLFEGAQLTSFVVPMMIAGVASEVYGAFMALVEKHVKRVIAYSSVSQMGYILFGLGTLTQRGLTGATLHVIYHAMVKALLFMVTGIVVHATGKRLIHELGGLRQDLPTTTLCAVIGVLAIAGTPPLGIFSSEWMIFSGGAETGALALTAAAIVGTLLTVAYALRFLVHLFFSDVPADVQVRSLSSAVLLPMVCLTVLTIVMGAWPAPLIRWVSHGTSLLLGGLR